MLLLLQLLLLLLLQLLQSVVDMRSCMRFRVHSAPLLEKIISDLGQTHLPSSSSICVTS